MGWVIFHSALVGDFTTGRNTLKIKAIKRVKIDLT